MKKFYQARPRGCRSYQMIAILRTVGDGETFHAVKPGQQAACIRLHQSGLLDRDLGLGRARWFIGNARGFAWICNHDDELERRANANR